MIFKNPHIIPDLNDWPINKLYSDRDNFITEVNNLVLSKLESRDIERILETTINREKKRVKNEPWQVDPADDSTYWQDLGKEINKAKASNYKEEELRAILERIINRYNEEIIAVFDPKTFKFFRRFLTAFNKRVYNKFWEKWHGFYGSREQVLKKLKTVGAVDRIRKMFPDHTIVLVPTHMSNFDSAVIGYTIDAVLGLPAFLYGAGLNLFNYEVVALAINRLGTYKLDRRKKNPIYMTCLLSMLALSLEKKTNNLFYPGGTRSRDGKIEQKLKLGLLGSVMEAQRNAFVKNDGNKILIFPVVMSYHFTFEAKSLIDNYLKKTYDEKYLKDKKQVKISGYFRKLYAGLFRNTTDYTLSIGEPMDVFGNAVDDDGNSIDANGDILDIKGYFELDGKVNANLQRETVYTAALGDHIASAFLKYNVVLTSHLVSYVLFQYLLHKNPNVELMELLNYSKEELQVPIDDFKQYVAKMLDILNQYAGENKLLLSEELRTMTIDEIVDHGLKHCGMYHAVKVICKNKQKIQSQNFRMLYYYHNRLDTYGFDTSSVFS